MFIQTPIIYNSRTAPSPETTSSMSSLSNVEAKLPPGFRFHPRDDELICDYLMKWVSGCPNQCPLLIEVDLNKCEPWDIPETALVGNKEWYFYSQKDKKYATGLRTNRATLEGYWKATGKDRVITRNRDLVGMRKTLVFYTGRAPKGKKTEWVMHEFRLEGPHWPGPKMVIKDGWVLCRVFYKNRSDVHPARLESANRSDNTSSQPLPMDPYISFQPASTIDHCDEQVPCFSMFTQNQTSPAFSLYNQMNAPDELIIMPSFGQIYTDLGNYDSPPLTNSSCDKKMMRAVMDHVTKIENSCNDISYNSITTLNGISSPSFGEGSPDSYLSEVDLSSMWNQY